MDDFRRRAVNRAKQEAPVVKEELPKVEVNTLSTLTDSADVIAPIVSGNSSVVKPQEITETANGRPTVKVKKPLVKRAGFWWLLAIVLVVIGSIVGSLLWVNVQLSAVNASKTDKQLVTIESGSTPDMIAATLKDEGLIRSSFVFTWYSKFQGVQGKLQAGTYRLSPSETTPDIIEHLTNGRVDTFDITFLPGATLAEDRQVLIDAGYDASEVDAALKAEYNSPLFDTKPASADLEGYIYGQTYSFATDTSVEKILETVFDEFYSVVTKNNLVALYQEQGLTLYEGITLASIVQREAGSAADMPEIAEVFYNRLAAGIPLGSDVTYQYIADKTGVARDPSLDSPYNTRVYAGLPPGPIAAPGEDALVAVAHPAVGDYLYFLSGDDDVTYYGRTLQEHEANISRYCQVKCQIL